MFFNISNHPSEGWSREQTAKALEIGRCDSIIDIHFPNVPNDAPSSKIYCMAYEIIHDMNVIYCSELRPVYAMIQGEFTLTYALVNILKDRGIKCVAATTQRIAYEDEQGFKKTLFKFQQFREY